MSFIWIVLGGITLTVGDIIFRYFWLHTNEWWLYAVGIVIYLIGLVFLVESYKYQNIAIASTAVVITNIILLSAVSWFYFDQKLSAYQLIGIMFGVIAIFILELSG